MLLNELQIEHLAGIIILPQIMKSAGNSVAAFIKALIWKFGTHLNKHDKVTINGEWVEILATNWSGLHVRYKDSGQERTISVSKLDSLDVRK